MKCFKILVFLLVIWASIITPLSAGWNSCIGCHNGTLAPDKDKLKEKHKTIDSFISAAQSTQNDLMKSIQKDVKSLQEAAKEIGLQ